MVRNQIPVVFFTPKGIPGELPAPSAQGQTIKLPGRCLAGHMCSTFDSTT